MYLYTYSWNTPSHAQGLFSVFLPNYMWSRRLSSQLKMDEEDFTRAFIKALSHDTVLKKLSVITKDLHTEIASLRQIIVKKDEKTAMLETKIYQLEKSQDALEQYTRRNSLRVSGAEEKENEDATEVALQLFNYTMNLENTHPVPRTSTVPIVWEKQCQANRGHYWLSLPLIVCVNEYSNAASTQSSGTQKMVPGETHKEVPLMSLLQAQLMMESTPHAPVVTAKSSSLTKTLLRPGLHFSTMLAWPRNQKTLMTVGHQTELYL